MSVYDAHVGPWTREEVLALPEDSHTRVELIGGALLLTPTPDIAHQRARRRLARHLHQAAQVAGAPVEVLEAVNVATAEGMLIPDIVVTTADATETADQTLPAQEVHLVVEITSSATEVIDRMVKPVLYAAAGIPHYWQVDPDPVPRARLGQLRRDIYHDTAVPAGTRLTATEPFPLSIDLGDLRTHLP